MILSGDLLGNEETRTMIRWCKASTHTRADLVVLESRGMSRRAMAKLMKKKTTDHFSEWLAACPPPVRVAVVESFRSRVDWLAVVTAVLTDERSN